MAKAIHKAKCETAWDGDDFGNEWKCGAAVYRADEGNAYRVFEDDGKGNGNHLCSFASVFDAREYANLHVNFLDEGGCAGSPSHILMCRLAEARGLDLPGTRVGDFHAAVDCV